METRERQGLTREDISGRLRVDTSFIKNLEEDNYENLPAKVYIQGFLKKYAQHLGLDEERVLALFRRSYVHQNPAPTPPQPLRKRSLSITPKFLIGALVSITIIAFLAFLYWQYRSYAGKPLLVITYPPEEITVNQNYIELRGKTDPTAELTINGQASSVEEDGSFNIAVGLEPGTNYLTITAESRAGKQTTAERQIEVVTEEP